MKKKKILTIVHCYSPSIGGTQLMAQKISEGLKSTNKYDITILTSNLIKSPHQKINKPIHKKSEMINGILVKRFSTIPLHKFFKIIKKLKLRLMNSKKNLHPYLSLLNNGPISFKLFWEAFWGDYDIIFTPSINYSPLFLGLLPNRYRKNKKLILLGAAHIDDYPDNNLPNKLVNLIKKWDYYLANTEYERDYMIDKGFPNNNVINLGGGVDIEKFDSSESIFGDHNQINKNLVVGYIGRVNESKNINILLKSIPIILKKLNNVTFLFAGVFDKAMKNSIETNFSNNVILIDNFNDEDKHKIYNAIDVFVSPSKSESFGITFIEAWAAKKPVVGVNIGSISSLIQHEKNGFICKPDDSKDIAKNILKLLENQKLRKRLGEYGHNFVKNNYSWDAIISKFESII